MGQHGGVVARETRTTGPTMKFKEWMDRFDEVDSKNNYRGDRSAANPASRFGSTMTQLPLSKDVDNAAIAGLAGGIGDAFRRNLRRMGHELSPTDRIDTPPWKMEKPHAEGASLPLQLPILDGRPLVGQGFNYGKAGIRSLIANGIVVEPVHRDSKVRTAEDPDVSPDKFEKYAEGQNEPIKGYQMALSFTQSLLHLAVRDKVREEQKDKYDLDSMRMESSQVDQNNVLTCVFSFKSNSLYKNKEDGGY